ncbi:MAG TPA: hypothetical protein VLH79_11755, partial [Chthonomonadales bacterium]|nr:hypothetical protein [Chthonomonadales bacterium]
MTAINRRVFVLGAACAGGAIAEGAAAWPVARPRTWYLHAPGPTGAYADGLRRAGLLGRGAGMAIRKALPGAYIEVGPWACAQSQVALAVARGAARARGGAWGVAFSPAGPTGRTRFLPGAENDDEAPDLGPSSALHRRVLYHALMAGADFVYDPAGPACTLASGGSGDLTSYGRVVRDLLAFARDHPDLGEPWTPLAFAVDGEAPREALEAALLPTGAQGDAESAVLPAMVAPETFDLLPATGAVRRKGPYRAVVALRPGGEQRAVEEARRWCPFAPETGAPLQVRHRATDGAWVVAVYNPRGARRADPFGTGCALDPACALRERLTPRFRVRSARALAAWPAGSRVGVR